MKKKETGCIGKFITLLFAASASFFLLGISIRSLVKRITEGAIDLFNLGGIHAIGDIFGFVFLFGFAVFILYTLPRRDK